MLSKYVKRINLEKELVINDYKIFSNFSYVANVILDTSKKRKTTILFEPQIDKTLWNSKQEWLYIFTINDRIIKIGGTRNGLKSRCQSYLCGHYTKDRNNEYNNYCSQTNAYIYNTFEYYLNNNHVIKMYGYQIPFISIKQTIFDQDVYINPQTFHAYESIAIQKYKHQTGSFPILNENCDPSYLLKK